MRLFVLLLLLPLVVQAITVSQSSASYSGTLAEDGTIAHAFDVRYISPRPIGSLTLTYDYLPARAYNVNWHGDRGTIVDSSITPNPENENYSILYLRAEFDGVASEYALSLSYNTPPDIKAYGRLVRTAACPNNIITNVTAHITLPAGSEFIASDPRADFAGFPPSTELHLQGCISLVYIRETDEGGYSMSSIGGNYLLQHNSQGNFSGEITNATAFIPRIESELGLPFPYAHMVYVILPNQSTDIVSWASGEYHGLGTVFLRPNATTSYGVEEAAVHEATHAFNSQVPQVWGADNWFDEGTAKYMEHLDAMEKGGYEGPVFSDNPRAKVRISDLIYYYNNNYTFMRDWDPTNSSFTQWQDFGYAYSQLVIRAYVDDHGPGSLRGTYACLATHGNDALPRPEFNNVVLGCMSNASGGADPEEIMNPGRSMMGNEADFTAYIKRISSPYFPNSEPTPTPTPAPQAVCDRHQISCDNCTFYQGCGWSRAQEKCLFGSESSSDDGSSSGSDWAWRRSDCAAGQPTPTPTPHPGFTPEPQPLPCCPTSLILFAAPLLIFISLHKNSAA